MITLVNYGAGNLRSVQNSLEELGTPYLTTNNATDVKESIKLILPGVGHFGQMIQALDTLDLREVLIEKIGAGTPFLGICVGLQCLFESSEESPQARGLGILPGQVRRFRGSERVPHMGWNSLDRIKPAKLLCGLDEEAFTYFAHSYYAPVVDATAATCTYVHPYTAVIEHGNLHAVQFHPEKSGPAGLRVLKNFVEL
ncbi:MAG: imidazole glycerol phosphate synthase subunit HisH [Acidobacteriota bacterium]|nr:imidazole glycerol phosphate synthase subunit HisH [Acidobacteriota bacterium]